MNYLRIIEIEELAGDQREEVQNRAYLDVNLFNLSDTSAKKLRGTFSI